MKRLPGTQHGFTMVEMLIAILLMTVGLLAVLTMQDVALNANSISMRLTVATSLAQEALEDILSWKSDDSRITTTAANVVYKWPPNSSATSISVPGAGSYSATYTTTVGPATGIPDGITRIVVTVTGGGRSVTVTGFKRTV
ncbi:type IV pilus modification PilV family protein [Geobacter argillaceus]|uniref:Type IV pilus assembly protein PilV n=1 Tax=Geobacter argillaceus TaxID=345631 RepID=A0A562WSN2_9BACT|nr:prepilin-type N-terminal cleavage/methylation domain-containing protein [Geobacter argillaceus]TWJ32434.1 type IV pilus assembly protein PilV [Geobacter argillaceus]